MDEINLKKGSLRLGNWEKVSIFAAAKQGSKQHTRRGEKFIKWLCSKGLNYSKNKFKNIRIVQIKGIYLHPLSTESHHGKPKGLKR